VVQKGLGGVDHQELDEHKSGSLVRLADEANGHHLAAGESVRSALNHAISAGKKLLEAKALVGHGRWTLWIDENFAGSKRTAEVYTRLARHEDQVRANAQGTAVITIDAALRSLATPREETPVQDVAVAPTPSPKRGVRRQAPGWDSDLAEFLHGQVKKELEAPPAITSRAAVLEPKVEREPDTVEAAATMVRELSRLGEMSSRVPAAVAARQMSGTPWKEDYAPNVQALHVWLGQVLKERSEATPGC
jgi:hypothetical protein